MSAVPKLKTCGLSGRFRVRGCRRQGAHFLRRVAGLRQQVAAICDHPPASQAAAAASKRLYFRRLPIQVGNVEASHHRHLVQAGSGLQQPLGQGADLNREAVCLDRRRCRGARKHGIAPTAGPGSGLWAAWSSNGFRLYWNHMPECFRCQRRHFSRARAPVSFRVSGRYRTCSARRGSQTGATRKEQFSKAYIHEAGRS